MLMGESENYVTTGHGMGSSLGKLSAEWKKFPFYNLDLCPFPLESEGKLCPPDPEISHIFIWPDFLHFR